MKRYSEFDSKLWPSTLPGILLLIPLWLMQWAQHLFDYPFYQLGVLPKSSEGLLGIVLMPFIHDSRDLHHLINNSMALFFLMTLLVYSYRKVFLQVLVFGWIMCGALLWIFASNHGSYHIGMSGVIYVLFGFLFTSGVIRAYLPLQAGSMLVVFLYGSMIWGIFPLVKQVSWEGHLTGLVSGVFLAIVFRKQGPQRPKYQYEVEQEMGIEPPDFEAELREQERQATVVHYDFIPENKTKPDDTQP